MSDGFAIDADQLRTHAQSVDAMRARFGAVKGASSHIAQDDAAYGLLCGWISAVLEGRHTRQDELIAAVENNLTLVAERLRSAADSYDGTDQEAAESIRQAGGGLV